MASKSEKKVKFIRVRGRIVPIKSKNGKKKPKKLAKASAKDRMESARRVISKDVKTGTHKVEQKARIGFLGLTAAGFFSSKIGKGAQSVFHKSGKAAERVGSQFKKRGGKSSSAPRVSMSGFSGRKATKLSKVASAAKFTGLFAVNRTARLIGRSSKLGALAMLTGFTGSTIVNQKAAMRRSGAIKKDLEKRGKEIRFFK